MNSLRPSRRAGRVALLATIIAIALGVAEPGPGATPFVTRPIAMDDLRPGVAYGPHRDAQRPGGPSPTRGQLEEDLRLLAKQWPVIRLYGSAEFAPQVLDLIRRDRLPLGVLLGVSIVTEARYDSSGQVIERPPGAIAANRREIEAGVKLANRYPSIVRALVVGNETQVYWSAGRVPQAQLIAAIREVRARVPQPVTTGDDFAFWESQDSGAVAAETDFVMVHLHPLWNGCQLETALAWLGHRYDAVVAAHPGKTVVIGETGWATRRNDEGDQGKLMKGAVGEAEQARYLADLTRWLAGTRVRAIVFEAFDENWKGGADPADVEKHWGLYRADRTPKLAAQATP